VSLLASVVGVLVTMAVVLKSWRLAILGMAPPMFAGASCVGLMALLNVPFNTVTSMMLAIALGIAVDDTIHYLWRYRQCRARGHSVARAVTATHLTIGQACTLSRIVIAAGFAVMGFSRFLPIAYFGGVISVVMGVALAANLVLLPALLLLVDRYGRRVETPA
jgi:predicted RND superfamily exporter protein